MIFCTLILIDCRDYKNDIGNTKALNYCINRKLLNSLEEE
jgi:hypothetical protein